MVGKTTGLVTDCLARFRGDLLAGEMGEAVGWAGYLSFVKSWPTASPLRRIILCRGEAIGQNGGKNDGSGRRLPRP
jgi:hypothetical protein